MSKNPVIQEVSSDQVGPSVLGEPVIIPTKLSGTPPLGSPSDSSFPQSPLSELPGGTDSTKVITVLPCKVPTKQAYVRVRTCDQWLSEIVMIGEEKTGYYIVPKWLIQNHKETFANMEVHHEC